MQKTGTEIPQEGNPKGAKMPKKKAHTAQNSIKYANTFVYLYAARQKGGRGGGGGGRKKREFKK